jgi:ribonucleotide reductase beta subunit family protein with ferritin-like domain
MENTTNLVQNEMLQHQSITNNYDEKIDSNVDNHEILTDPKNNERLTAFPILYPKLWDMYKVQEAAFWRVEEINFSNDRDDFEKLTKNEQHFIKMILAFFAASDGIVNFNLRTRFMNEITLMEAIRVYTWQMAMEDIHNETYSVMLENLIRDPVEREKLFTAIKTVESIKCMADWAFKWIESKDSLAYRLIAFACVEAIFFSGAFASIFWLKSTKGEKILDGLMKSNKFIARDEGLHCKYACMLYEMIGKKLSEETVHSIIAEAVEISKKFMTDALPCSLIGMNSGLMNQYIEYIGDTLLVMLNYNKQFNVVNPFPFMESIGMLDKTNFFESRPTEYASASGTGNNSAKDNYDELADF